ncbi:MAG: glycoside hydrolase family 20 zincin-like fold domain-containing protein, partial [Draconibacterium sp.]|nr:glycoside hydrolase family 20 zincin-like fold domain-containing protein [Draconibacterium sp.]
MNLLQQTKIFVSQGTNTICIIKKSILFFVFIAFAFLAFSQQVSIVPQPSHVIHQNGVFKFQEVITFQLFGIDEDFLSAGIQQLKDEFDNDFGVKLERGEAAEILIGIQDKDENFRKLCLKNDLLKSDDLGEQGYELKISKRRIIIAANSAQGLFYGIQTLKQLIRSAEEKQLSCLFIHDVPVLKYRGVMDDISRGPIPTMEFMKYQIRRLAELKINMFSFYIEHVVKTKKHPGFAP